MPNINNILHWQFAKSETITSFWNLSNIEICLKKILLLQQQQKKHKLFFSVLIIIELKSKMQQYR